MATVYQDIFNYYYNNPPITIDDNTRSKYISLLEKTLENTLLEYSKYKPIYEVKEIKTNDNQDKIDIYTDISDRLIDIIYFNEKSKLNNDFNRFFYYYNGINFKRKLNTGSLLALISDFEYYQAIKEYFQLDIQRKIVGGRYIIGLKPNTEYIVAYTRYRLPEELYLNDKLNFEKLFELNLLDNLYSDSNFINSNDGNVRSVSVSSISISFNTPSIESIKKTIKTEKDKLIKNLLDEDFYLPEIF